MADYGEAGSRLDNELGDLRARLNGLTEKLESFDQLISIVSHDIISASSSSAGLLSRLLKSDLDNLNDHQRKILETLERSAKFQNSVINNISELSRILRGKARVNLVKVKVDDLLEKVCDEFKEMAGAKNIELSYRPDSGMWIKTDMDKTCLALKQIVTNAIWFTRPGGKVKLSAEIGQGAVSLKVEDNGPGVEPGLLGRLFDLSRREFTLGTAEEKGAGLGLYVAREMTALCGGELKIESEEGAGATVWLTYPVWEPSKAD